MTASTSRPSTRAILAVLFTGVLMGALDAGLFAVGLRALSLTLIGLALNNLDAAALGVTPQAATWMLLPIVLTLAIGAPVMGRLPDHTGPRRIIIAALVMLACGCFALALLPTTTSNLLLGAGVLIGGIAASAGGGASGYREAFGLIGIVVVAMVVLSFALVNRRAGIVVAQPEAAAP